MNDKNFADVDPKRLEKLIDIKRAFLDEKISLEEARKEVSEHYDHLTPSEFAYSEQQLKELGYSDDLVHEKMEMLIELPGELLQKTRPQLPAGHPIRTYLEENKAIRQLLEEMETAKQYPFDRSAWIKFYDRLHQFNIHLARKQNQLFSKLEENGFDRPSKIMWTFDNDAKKAIAHAQKLLESAADDHFYAAHAGVREQLLDLMEKEELILYPTALEMITDPEFSEMRSGDDEIGYCLIDPPPAYEGSSPKKSPDLPAEFLRDLRQLLNKYHLEQSPETLNVRQGKITLEQLNLIIQNLPFDISFVDENELVRFYSDTKHRIFPRSPGVIGRNVMNCHPRESLDTVQRIIEAFRSGAQDKAEFWIQMGEKFIYILYIALRDEQDRFKGVMEIMQDATHIRSLQGNRRLLAWDDEPVLTEKNMDADQSWNKDTLLFDLLQKYPFLKEFMQTISPKYKKLMNPITFNTIGRAATLEMVAKRGEIEFSELLQKLKQRILDEES